MIDDETKKRVLSGLLKTLHSNEVGSVTGDDDDEEGDDGEEFDATKCPYCGHTLGADNGDCSMHSYKAAEKAPAKKSKAIVVGIGKKK